MSVSVLSKFNGLGKAMLLSGRIGPDVVAAIGMRLCVEQGIVAKYQMRLM